METLTYERRDTATLTFKATLHGLTFHEQKDRIQSDSKDPFARLQLRAVADHQLVFQSVSHVCLI